MRILADTSGWSYEQWLEWRKAHPSVGASMVAAVLGLSPYQTPLGAWSILTGREQSEDSLAARMGRLMEPLILDEYRAHVGPCDPVPAVLQHETVDCLTCNLDAAVPLTTPGTVVPVEAKHGSYHHRDHWLALRDGDIAAIRGTNVGAYYVQIQAQMAVTGADHAWFAVVLDKRWLDGIRVERDDELIGLIEREVPAWWERHVVADEPPPPRLEDAGKVPRRPDLDDVDLDWMTDAVDEYHRLGQQIKKVTEPLSSRRALVQAQIELGLYKTRARTGKAGRYKIQLTRDSVRTDWQAVAASVGAQPQPEHLTIRPGVLRVTEGK